MKILLPTVLTSILLAVASASAATKVFVLAGQSNMEGAGGYGTSPAPPPYDATQSDVYIWAKDGTSPDPTQWSSLKPGFGYGLCPSLSGIPAYANCFGPELTFGYQLHALFPNDDIYLVKYANGATNLANYWNPDGGSCYRDLKATVDAALLNLSNAGRSPQIAGMIWMQGESDAKNDSYAAAYGANLTNFIAHVRSDFKTPDMPFVLARINTHWGTTANNNLVRTAEQTVPGQVGRASWFDTDDLGIWATYPPDVYHYNTQGQIDLGIRFANSIAAIVPEPSLYVMAATGVLAWFAYAWRKRR